jgi:DNA-binding HxlR family transcriptional regulator
MRDRRYDCNFGCSVEATLDVIGGKWKGTILYHLLDKSCRFNELRRTMPDITQRMLTLQLRELEEDGIIKRTVYAQVPPHVDYSLTDFGRSLEPILLLMRDWGTTYVAELRQQRSMAEAAKSSSEGVLQENEA